MTSRVLWPFAEKRDSAWVAAVVEKAFAKEANVRWWTMDSWYWLPGSDDFARLLAWDPGNTWEYLVDRFDCESFAFGLQAHLVERLGLNCVGVVLDYSAVDGAGNAAPHAYNLAVFEDGTYAFLEPQADQYVQTGAGQYVAKDVVLLL